MLKDNVKPAGSNPMQHPDIKTAAHQLIDPLDQPTWAERACRVAVKASIAQRLS